ncbi:PREDICTED: uncharacterized protein LOC109345635 isoform X4 [Lupinus angustifolius]|uniref:uncharacterized protein LOC109345635 isoform X4 n=1 Tax=Lupinus angustifolius TaxID=3871 RepID=UPI00092F4F29|nr:PREDICTED: uncharacterized protein LOC109345635 isoform X4 [Lupinus angustifolius]
MAIELVDYSCTKTLGRKRVEASPSATPLKRMCSGGITFISENSPLEALPLDILTLIAKGTYFEYRTPKKKTFVFYDPINNANRSHDIEAPNAPLRKSKSRLNRNKFDDISVNLFDFMVEEI